MSTDTTPNNIERLHSNPNALAPKYLDIEGASQRIGMSRSFLYHAVQRREIAFLKIGTALRFEVSELDAFMDVRRVAPLTQGAKR